jgi:hypothetical protein
MMRQGACCKTILGSTSLDNAGGVTHGICLPCSLLLLRQASYSTTNVRVSESPRGVPHVESVR